MLIEYAVVQHLADNHRTAIRTRGSPCNISSRWYFWIFYFSQRKNEQNQCLFYQVQLTSARDLYQNRKEQFDNRLDELRLIGPVAIIKRNTFSGWMVQ